MKYSVGMVEVCANVTNVTIYGTNWLSVGPDSAHAEFLGVFCLFFFAPSKL